ncbi:Tn3 family transposase [Microbispora sp. NEAU-D428]|nr:Tn3 family transposase [Microbispora sitophila]
MNALGLPEQPAPMLTGHATALTRDRLHHVDQNYVRFETMAAANVPLVEAQAEIELAQAWGGGLVASVDGLRFVVPVRTLYAWPNPKYFGRKRGITWPNMINDQAAGLTAKVLSGTPARLTARRRCGARPAGRRSAGGDHHRYRVLQTAPPAAASTSTGLPSTGRTCAGSR